MSTRFQEIDRRSTPWGEISLRRRWDPTLDIEVYEIKLDDDFLMSSLFTVAEVEMARLALAGMPGSGLDVAVGGLGLGYTAHAVLKTPGVTSLFVVEALGEVIEWHERGSIPGGAELTSDQRCDLVHGDFFAMLRAESGLDPRQPGRRFHCVLVDIDHSPRHVLHPSHAAFYETTGLQRLARCLHPHGVFALWSNDPPDEEFTDTLSSVFAEVRAEIVSFHNPLQKAEATNTVYLARS
ncbi:spermidine synthase [Phytoactinopolyspora halotolerans]|uniref:Spermidine synthase n=1 Tax=Phytoactinopolyspora halotolerans TaxID=1981512 RepID=A0A6L9SIN7_9ACTN|nr:spermidine synthase [Phytoactinopolyspora halotolerans]NEE04191.1 spermidine synthase [Phytoactinopolyspora halotolerans]